MDPLDFFPYQPRFGQKEIIRKIFNAAMDGRRIFLDAPTGWGKTPVILAALLPIAINLDKTVLWCVRTGNETDRPIEELLSIKERTGLGIIGLSIRGKRDMCLLAREKEIRDQEAVSVLCRKMRNKCPYYLNLANFRFKFTRPLIFYDILKLGISKGVCPYFLQLSILPNAAVVSMSYNYIFAESIRWVLRHYVKMRDSILVIDEAHNLQNVISNINSDRVTIGTVDRALNEVSSFKDRRAQHLKTKLKKLRKILEEEGENIKGEDDIFDPLKLIDEPEFDDDDFEYGFRLVSKIYSKQLSEGKAPRSSLRHILDFLRTSLEYVSVDGVVFLKYKDKGRIVFERWDMRAAEVLEEIWNYFYTTIFMSGTLKPFRAFADIAGIDSYEGLTASFKIPRENILALVIKDVSTRGEELSEEMREKYAVMLREILNVLNVNTAVFFSSYRIMNDLQEAIADIAKSQQRNLFIEYEGMSGDKAREILDNFKKETNGILCASMSGRFAEGADFPGRELEAVVLVGIPFERVTTRTHLYISYYQKIYGPDRGRYYSYVIPALKRSSQAMGRALRSPQDRAILIAADERYWNKQYFELLPSYFKEGAKLVNIAAAVEFIEDFLHS